ISILRAGANTDSRKQIRVSSAVTAQDCPVSPQLDLKVYWVSTGTNVTVEITRHSLPAEDNPIRMLLIGNSDVNTCIGAFRSTKIQVFPKTGNHRIAAECSRR